MSSIEKINMCLEELNVGMSRYNQEILMSKDQAFVNIYRKKIESIILKAKDIISNELLPIIKSTNELLEGNIFMFHHTTNYTNEFFEKQVNFVLLSQEHSISL